MLTSLGLFGVGSREKVWYGFVSGFGFVLLFLEYLPPLGYSSGLSRGVWYELPLGWSYELSHEEFSMNLLFGLDLSGHSLSTSLVLFRGSES